MQLKLYAKLNHMLKKSLLFGLMLGVVAFAIASSGGGRKRSALHSPVFSTLRPSAAITLKSRPATANSSLMFCNSGRGNIVTYKSVVTYQKGNTIYMVPSQYRMINSPRLSVRNNLNAVDLKIRLPR
jgi:hypothetical protein